MEKAKAEIGAGSPQLKGESLAIIYFPDQPKPRVIKNQRKCQYPEAEIFSIAAKKLRSEGWRVVSEIPLHSSYRFVDGGALKDGVVLAIEAKVYLSNVLIRQVATTQLASDHVLVVIKKMPKTNRNKYFQWLVKENIGVWQINGEIVNEIRPWGENKHTSENYRKSFEKHCRGGVEGLPGGLPTVRGEGPAMACLKRVREYQGHNPKAKWKEIHTNVLNHYSSPQSMRGALKKVQF